MKSFIPSFIRENKTLNEYCTKSINSGFIHLLISNFLLKFFTFGSQIFVAWLITKEDIGRISVMQKFLGLVVILAGFGYNSAILKYASENISKEKAYTYFFYGNKYSLITTIIAFVLSLFLAQLKIFSPDPVVNRIIPFFFLMLFSQTVSVNILSYLQALQRIKDFAIIQVYTKVISVLVIFILTYYFLFYGYIIAIIIGSFLTLALLIYHNQKFKFQLIEGNFFKKLTNYAIPSMTERFITTFGNGSDLLILNYLEKDRNIVGGYAFILIFINALKIVSQSNRKILIPKFSKSSNNKTKVLQQLTNYLKKWIPISILITILFIAFGLIFLTYFKKGTYSDSIFPFVMLSLNWPFYTISSIIGGMYFGTGRVNRNLIIVTPYISLMILIYYYSYIYYGVNGLSIAVLGTSIIWALIRYLDFKFLYKTEKKPYD